jgi:hypothetical protein
MRGVVLEQGSAVELHGGVLNKMLNKLTEKQLIIVVENLVVVALLQPVRAQQRARVMVAPLGLELVIRETESDLHNVMNQRMKGVYCDDSTHEIERGLNAARYLPLLRIGGHKVPEESGDELGVAGGWKLQNIKQNRL